MAQPIVLVQERGEDKICSIYHLLGPRRDLGLEFCACAKDGLSRCCMGAPRCRGSNGGVELYPLSNGDGCGYLADTPGFTMLDFERFDFFEKEDLPATFREFAPYIGACRYTKCSHTKEDGCAILEEIKNGRIARSRHDSFMEIYSILKDKKEWDK